MKQGNPPQVQASAESD